MTMTTEFQLVDINKLVPYANNARTLCLSSKKCIKGARKST